MNGQTRFRGMRSRTPAVLLAAVLVLVMAVFGGLLLSSYREQIREAEAVTRNLASLLQTQLYETLRRADADIASLAVEIPKDALDSDAVVRYQSDVGSRLANRLKNVERMDGVYVFDAGGCVLYFSGEIPSPSINVSERAYFKKLRDDPEAGLIVSDVVKSEVSGNNVVVVSRGIRDEGGRFLGGVASPFDLDRYAEQFAALDVGKRGFIALRRNDNHALALIWPDSDQAHVSRELPADHPFVSSLTAGSSETVFRDESHADIKGRVVSLKKVPQYPFYFVVGLDRDEVLSEWYAQVALVGFAMLVVLGLVAGLVIRLGRMRKREAVILSNLAKSESQFSDLVQLVPVGISRFDATGKCVFVNDRNLTITGRSRESLVGNDWSNFVYRDDQEALRALCVDRKADGDVFGCEYRLVRPGGELVHVIGQVKVERGPGKEVVGYIVAQTDISLLKKVEAELVCAKRQAEQSSQAKTRFLAAASHDLRQPIQAINLFKDALCRSGLNSEQEKIAKFLSASVRSLSDLLYSLLDISKLDAGLVRPQMKEVELGEIFAALDEEFSSLAGEKKLRFKFSFPFDGPPLYTDPSLLLCVLRNLVDNAFKYTKSGGVLVGFRRRQSHGVVQVWDTGVGIAPAIGSKIFDECFQVSNPEGDRTKGMGIGLSIARRTARLLGGDVTYRSRPGAGSVFEVSVALGRRCVSVGPGCGVGETDGRKQEDVDLSMFAGWRVVVVEDDPVVSQSIQLSLQAVGIEVEQFSSAEEALASPKLLTKDFYISDFVLPGRDGLQLLDEIQKRSGHAINGVLMTGETLPSKMELAQASRWTIVLKPTGLGNLLSVMNNVVKDADAFASADSCRE